MITSENILTAEFASPHETVIKVTYRHNDDVYVDQFQNNPKKLEFKTLVAAGWDLKKIRSETKRLEKFKDKSPAIQMIERIANGYAWAKDEVEKIRAEKDYLNKELENSRKELKDLYVEKMNASSVVTDLYAEHKAAIETLQDLYVEQKDATSVLKELYSEQGTASTRVADLYQEYEEQGEDQAKIFQEKIRNMKTKMQDNYDKYQELYGTNIMDVIFEENSVEKEFLFKAKLEVLAREEFKKIDKKIRTKVRKAQTIKELILIVYDVIGETKEK